MSLKETISFVENLGMAQRAGMGGKGGGGGVKERGGCRSCFCVIMNQCLRKSICGSPFIPLELVSLKCC